MTSTLSPFDEYDQYEQQTRRVLGIRSHSNAIVREPTLITKIVQKYRNKQNASQYNNGSGYIPSMCAIGGVYRAYVKNKKTPIADDGTLPDEAIKKLFAKKYETKKVECTKKNQSAKGAKPKGANTQGAKGAKPKRKLNEYTKHMKDFLGAGWAMESAAYVYKQNQKRKTPIKSSDAATRKRLEQEEQKGIKQLSQKQLDRLSALYQRIHADINVRATDVIENRMRSFHSMIIFRAYRKAGWSPKATSAIFDKVVDSTESIDSLPLPMEFPQKWQLYAPDSYNDRMVPIRQGRVQKKRAKVQAKKLNAAKNERKTTDDLEFEQDLTGL
jgi:hypothetical protein